MSLLSCPMCSLMIPMWWTQQPNSSPSRTSSRQKEAQEYDQAFWTTPNSRTNSSTTGAYRMSTVEANEQLLIRMKRLEAQQIRTLAEPLIPSAPISQTSFSNPEYSTQLFCPVAHDQVCRLYVQLSKIVFLNQKILNKFIHFFIFFQFRIFKHFRYILTNIQPQPSHKKLEQDSRLYKITFYILCTHL